MKLQHDALHQHLNANLLPVYCISGDEPLLVDEVLSSIRNAARQQGFEERQRLQVDKQFQWQSLLDARDNLSLFAEKRLIELHLPTGKPGKQGSDILVQYCEHTNPDNILIIVSSKIEKNQQNSRWYKALDKAGATLQLWPPNRTQLPQWLKQRLQQQGLNAEQQGLQLLADYCEGNLLSAQQEILKLSLLHGNADNTSVMLTSEQIHGAIADNARFNVFNFVDSVLTPDPQRMIRMLQRLQSEKVEPTLILWALSNELRNLQKIILGQQQGESLATLLRQHRVWGPRESIIKRAIPQFSLKNIYRLLSAASRIDNVMKGIDRGNVWDMLSQFCIAMQPKQQHHHAR